MSKPFDATVNALIDLRASQWADCFARAAGLPTGPSTPIDTDLSTTLQADRVFRIGGEKPYLLHLEIEANPRTGIPGELHRYNTMIDHQHGLPVETVLILLRPKALVSDMTGQYRRVGVTGKPIAEFNYHIERVWKRPADYWLHSGIGLAALALLTDEAQPDLERNVQRLKDQIESEDVDETARHRVFNSAYFLCGLRYNLVGAVEIFRRLNMLLEESTTYQDVLKKGEAKGEAKGKIEGKIEGERSVLLKLGAERFGQPDAQIVAALHAISDPDRLDRLVGRLLHVGSWNELVAVK